MNKNWRPGLVNTNWELRPGAGTKDRAGSWKYKHPGNPAIAKRFIRNLKNKIYKYMTSVSKNAYIDKLDDS